MSELTITLPEDSFRELSEKAARLGVTPEQLVSASVADLLGRPDEAFTRLIEYVLAKNAELYRRLS